MKPIKFLSLLCLLLAFTLTAFSEAFTLPEDVQEIGAEAFRNCAEFTGTLVIPDSVETIGDYAFADCTGFTGVPIIPETVRRIGPHAFDGCTGLSGTLVLSPEIDVDETAFLNCPSLEVVRKEAEVIRVAAILDEGGINDHGFNQAIYEAASQFCAANDLDFNYYILQWNEESNLDTVINDGYNVIIAAGFTFADVISEGQIAYPDVRYIGLDISAEDLYEVAPNTFCVTFREEQAGFLAGYAAVKLGYTHLGFLGGMDMPAVNRYGYGFIQGADAAAVELGISESVDVRISYANQFWGDANLTARMADWYETEGVQVVFACGGGIYTSVAEAAAQVPGAKVIGVDVDQRAVIDGDYGSGLTLTSAMKNLGATVRYALEKIVADDWEEIGGTSPVLGIVSSTVSENHVGLAPSTQYGNGFSETDYMALVAGLLNGTYAVSQATDDLPEVSIQVLDEDEGTEEVLRVAAILDEGGIDDHGFNQAIYEAASQFCAANDLDFNYYILQWNEESNLDTVINDGYNVIIAAGFTFADVISEGQIAYPDVRFIGLDISEEDLNEVAPNTFCATFREEQAGFLAGYAAVKLGYTHLGFLGGMDMPAVNRYGYGFVQGADAAAEELEIVDQVVVEFSYADQFWGDAALTARMADWYETEGVQVVFTCGGGIYASVAEAAAQVPGAKVIGVDVDQQAVIDGDYASGLTLTSAMKNLGATVRYALEKIVAGDWEEIGGTSPVLGIVSSTVSENHVGLAPSTQYGNGFTAADYTALLGDILDGTYVISSATDALPDTAVQVNVH